MPVIDVRAPKGEKVTIQGHASLRKLTEPTKACTIEAGIYHPWSDAHNVLVFYSILPLEKYEVRKDIEEHGLKKGDVLDMVMYASEGYCNYTHISGASKTSAQIFCDSIRGDGFKKVEYPAHPSEHWLYVQCAEGHKAFVQDTDLFKQTGDRAGTICGHGHVAAQGSCAPKAE